MSRHTHRFLNAGLLFLMGLTVSSCMPGSGGKVWTENGQLHTAQGPYFIQGVCYHPVAIGDSLRSFESLGQDLALMRDMGVNTIRVYEPIASQAVLDEISQADSRSSLGLATTKRVFTT